MTQVEATFVQIKDKETGKLGKPVGLHPDIANHRISSGEAVLYRPKKFSAKSPLKEKPNG